MLLTIEPETFYDHLSSIALIIFQRKGVFHDLCWWTEDPSFLVDLCRRLSWDFVPRTNHLDNNPFFALFNQHHDTKMARRTWPPLQPVYSLPFRPSPILGMHQWFIISSDGHRLKNRRQSRLHTASPPFYPNSGPRSCVLFSALMFIGLHLFLFIFWCNIPEFELHDHSPLTLVVATTQHVWLVSTTSSSAFCWLRRHISPSTSTNTNRSSQLRYPHNKTWSFWLSLNIIIPIWVAQLSVESPPWPSRIFD